MNPPLRLAIPSLFVFFFLGPSVLCLQAQTTDPALARAAEIHELRQELIAINARLTKLEGAEATDTTNAAPDENAAALRAASASLSTGNTQQKTPDSQPLTTTDRATLSFLNGTTINMVMDGYYAYNFNDPIGRANLLRAYDVSSNAFSLNQADFIIEHAPDLANGKRFGARIDLQFGQATETLQGNTANEARPEIYRNIFQAYGTYIAPIGSGLSIDFGKWASSLGIEGNYTKDQMNYSRSYWFDYLPFYHAGLRVNYAFTPWISGHYWMVNNVNQSPIYISFLDLRKT